MPLFLKALDPTIDVLGNEQVLKYNADQINNDANLLLLNAFTANAGIFPLTGLSFANSNFKGFRFYHESLNGSVYGNFSLQTYNKYGISNDIFKYDEQTDGVIFSKNVILNNTGASSVSTSFLVSNNGVDVADFGFNNSTNEAYVWAYGTSSLKFGTADTLRMRLLNNGTLDLLTNTVTTSGDINATTGNLKGNNLSAHSASSIGVGSSLAMNNNSITGLANPINNQDAATKQYVDAIGAPRSIMQGVMLANQGGDEIATGQHVKFDSALYTKGTSISLDVSTPYNNSANTASIGRITLAAGKTYKLIATVSRAYLTTPSGYFVLKWYNSDASTFIGVANTWWGSVYTETSGGAVMAMITTTVATRVELHISTSASFTFIYGTGVSGGGATFIIEEL